jgi:glycogen debranching enzyme
MAQPQPGGLAMMQTSTRYGDYPYAGVPWFCAPFGRDGIITAFECLWANPGVARGVLACLAATPGHRRDPAARLPAGKILHEMRTGEMAARGECRSTRYYGSHDATPLFVMLAAAYYERTDDTAFMQRIWPSIEAALTWIDRYGDIDDDGFIEYARRNRTAWSTRAGKTRTDAIFTPMAGSQNLP